MSLPANLYYTKEHEWVRLSEDGTTATVGITDFAQSQLGDIVFVELGEVDSDIAQDSTFGTVEAVKTVSDLYAPLSGTILEVNADLDGNPQYVNEDPYGAGWMIRMSVANPAEIEHLMSADAYGEMIA